MKYVFKPGHPGAQIFQDGRTVRAGDEVELSADDLARHGKYAKGVDGASAFVPVKPEAKPAAR